VRPARLLILFGKSDMCFNKRSYLMQLFVKNGDEASYSNYQAISLLPAEYQILPSILLSRLTSYVDEIIGGFPGAFKRTG
jgi:hypothetical protein